MSNFVLILLCLSAGYILRQKRKLSAEAPAALNALIIYLAFPALVLVKTPELFRSGVFSRAEAFMPLTMGWLIVGFAAFVFTMIGRRLGWSEKTIGALILTAGFSNTSFVGFPVLEALIGPEAIKIGIISDQSGTFLCLSTLGLALAAYFAGGQVTVREMARRIFLFPPFLALAASALIVVFDLTLPEALVAILDRVSSMIVPLALLSVGAQLRLDSASLRSQWGPVTCGLIYKLVIAPLFIGILFIGLCQQTGFTAKVTLLESAMAPMITGAIISADFGLDVEVANLLLGVGIPLSLATVPIVLWIAQIWGRV
jgi:predicted permease